MMRINALSALAAALLVVPSSLPAAGSILEDFQFGDVAGTTPDAAFNSAGTGHMWDTDSPDLDGVVTNGSGQLDAAAKANNDFGSIYVDLDPGTTGSVINFGELYSVMELSFAFDPSTLDTSENEEIRLSLIRDDPRSTFVTAEFEIQREDDNTVSIFGNAVGTGSSDTGSANLGLTESSLVVVTAVNLSVDTLDVHYSVDGGTTFSTLPGGVLNSSRGVAALRMVLNNDLSDDSVLIDRVYLTDMNPFPGLIPDAIPEPGTAALLMVSSAFMALRRTR